MMRWNLWCLGYGLLVPDAQSSRVENEICGALVGYYSASGGTSASYFSIVILSIPPFLHHIFSASCLGSPFGIQSLVKGSEVQEIESLRFTVEKERR